MYRRAAQMTTRAFNIIADSTVATGEAIVKAMKSLGWVEMIKLAERENRQRDRYYKRHAKHSTYHADNGQRAKDRRLRQIASGRLTVANGLVA